MQSRVPQRGPGAKRAPRAPLVVWLAVFCAAGAMAATLAERARESGCVNRPVLVTGDTYRCATESGAFSYFNVPGGGGARPAAKAPTPADFPRVDPETQKGRDGVRRKVLTDELAAEEQLLTEARAAYAEGAPLPLPEERADAEKYRARIGRLRQAVTVHERNIEALKKELATVK
jgi:hypothetical protein